MKKESKNNAAQESIKRLIQTGFFHVFGSSTLNKIIVFLSGILLVRILSKAEYGVFSYAYNIYSFFALASGLGIVSSILQVCSEQRDELKRKELYQYGCRTGLLINAFIAVLIFVIATLVPLPIKGANFLLQMLCLLPLFTLTSELQRTYLRTELRNKEFSYANIASSVAMLALSCLLSFAMGAVGLVLAYYFVAVFTTIFIVLVYKVPYSLKQVKLELSKKKTIWYIGVVSMLNNGLSQLMYLLDVFVIGMIISDGAVIASYKVATIIPTGLVFIPAAVITYVYPYFARNKDNKTWVISMYKKLTFAMGIVNFVIAVILFFTADWMVELIFGAQYLDAVTSYQILLISYMISGTFRVIAGNLLVTQRKIIFNLLVAIISSLVNFGLNYLLISKIGMTGAAYATLITVVLTSLANTYYLIKTFYSIKEEDR